MAVATRGPEIPAGVTLTNRQQEVWDLTFGLNGQPKLGAEEISKKLGISTNSVYVTRRRVRAKIEESEALAPRAPKNIIRLGNGVLDGGLDDVADTLRVRLDGYTREESELRKRLQQIEKERPEIEKMLARLEKLTAAEDKEEEKVPAAA
jgi:hypothetical protein